MFAFLTLVTCVSLIQTYIATPRTKKFFMNLFEISELCQQDFNYRLDRKVVVNLVFIHAAFIVLFFVVTQNSMFLFEKFNRQQQIPFTKTVCAIFFYVYLYAVDLKFCFMVNMVNFDLGVICKLIEATFHPAISNVGNLNINIKQVTARNIIKEYEKKILKVRRIYKLISENAEIINRSMGITVLMITLASIVSITVTGFRILLVLLGKFPIDRLTGES